LLRQTPLLALRRWSRFHRPEPYCCFFACLCFACLCFACLAWRAASRLAVSCCAARKHRAPRTTARRPRSERCRVGWICPRSTPTTAVPGVGAGVGEGVVPSSRGRGWCPPRGGGGGALLAGEGVVPSSRGREMPLSVTGGAVPSHLSTC